MQHVDENEEEYWNNDQDLAQLLSDFRNLKSERVFRDYIKLVNDVDNYAKLVHNDELCIDFIRKDMQKKGIINLY